MKNNTSPQILYCISKFLYSLAGSFRNFTITIIRMDGGTASQISNYVCYRFLCERYGPKFKVDLSFYDNNMDDENSVVARPFSIDKLFDVSDINVAGKCERKLYKKLFNYSPNQDDKKNGMSVDLSHYKMPNPPLYFDSYYDLPWNMMEEGIHKYLKVRNVEEIIDD